MHVVQSGLKTFFIGSNLLAPCKKQFYNILQLLSKQSEKQATAITKEAAHRFKYMDKIRGKTLKL